ncbi:MAG: hypothetical protein L3J32_09015 [Rhizobiaceae bacterium]|nr:hypothetical protein [Rhizobiaceae bacterium]
MLLNGAILAVVVVTGIILLLPALSQSTGWKAMITPLASIIGSGFLVLGPILESSYGQYAPLVMAALCVGAFLYGSAIRYNIATIKRDKDDRSQLENRLEIAASWSLAFAYIISVAYYLNLFGAFGVSLLSFGDSFHANLLTSAVFLGILFVGLLYGFSALERMEQISVGLKLAIIAGLLAGLAWYFSQKATGEGLIYNPPTLTGWAGVTLVFGLLVTVQGFETSRYLGENYSAAIRIRSMRNAQFLSSAIYMIYIALFAYVFTPDEIVLEETAIIDMMAVVAPVLPLLLVAAALSAQFSAAVADTSGSGGLVAELTRNRIRSNHAYILLVTIGLVLTWTLNVFEIISYASRAFAFYYGLQSAIAAMGAWRNRQKGYHLPLYLALTLLSAAIVIFGTSVE